MSDEKDDRIATPEETAAAAEEVAGRREELLFRLADGERVESNLYGDAAKWAPILKRLSAPGVHRLEDVAEELGIDLNEEGQGE